QTLSGCPASRKHPAEIDQRRTWLSPPAHGCRRRRAKSPFAEKESAEAQNASADCKGLHAGGEGTPHGNRGKSPLTALISGAHARPEHRNARRGNEQSDL